jgi:type I restriction modification DNA specificity protein
MAIDSVNSNRIIDQVAPVKRTRAGNLVKKPLGQVANVFTGLSVSRPPTEGSPAQPVPVISIRDLEAGRVASLECLSSLELRVGAHTDRYRVWEGDVLATGRGTQFKVASVALDSAGAVANSNLIVVRPGPEVLSGVVLAFLQSPAVQAEMLRGTRSSAGSIALSARDLRQLLIPVPPLDEQQRIVEFLKVVETSYRTGVRAAELRRQLGHELVRKKLFEEP